LCEQNANIYIGDNDGYKIFELENDERDLYDCDFMALNIVDIIKVYS